MRSKIHWLESPRLLALRLLDLSENLGKCSSHQHIDLRVRIGDSTS